MVDVLVDTMGRVGIFSCQREPKITYGRKDMFKFATVALLVCGLALGLWSGCATSARKSLVDQGSPQAQKLADVLGEAQATTLEGAEKFFTLKREHQVTDIAKWKADAEAKGTFGSPANQFFYSQLQLGIQSTDNKLKLIGDLKAEAAKVPTGTVAPVDASK